MGQFDRQIATALRLIKKNGQPVKWRQIPTTEPDPLKPWKPVGGAPVDRTVDICFLPLDLQNKEFLASLGNTEAAVGSFYGLMGAVSFTPNIKDVVLRDGVLLEIASIDLLSPNGQAILYTVIFNG